MIGFALINYAYYDHYYRSYVRMMNKVTHQEFLARRLRSARVRQTRENRDLVKLGLTAVNAPKLRIPIRQPCWRAGRWKSLT